MKNALKQSGITCVLHGSFRKHYSEIQRVHRLFSENGITVLAPALADITSTDNGFAVLATDTEKDPRLIELLYLHHLKRLGHSGFSYFVNPEGYIGKSASYELGIAQVANIPCFFLESPADHPVYVHRNAVLQPEQLVEYIRTHDRLPESKAKRDEALIHKLWLDLMVPGSVVAVGGMIEYAPDAAVSGEKEILLVKTHKWGGRYSIVGGKVKRNERLHDALIREVREETGLEAFPAAHICTFDQIQNSGYYVPGVQHIFVDKIVQVRSKRVRLNEEAEEYLWVPASIALAELPIEPNARHLLELYYQLHQ